MKKMIGMIAAGALALTLALPASAAGRTFQDVETNHWAYSYVNRAADSGWVSGVGNGSYKPESQVTGAEFVTMITKSFYPQEVGQAQSGQPWYQGFVNTANAHGLLTHGMNTTAALNAPITRYNMATVLYNVADDAGMLKPTSDGFLSADGSQEWNYNNAHFYIGDWESVPAEYREAVLACYAMNLLSGNDAQGSFGGFSSMTRAQAAVVLCRTYDGTTQNGVVDTQSITKEEAKTIALQHAGLTASQVNFYRVYEDWDDGRYVYEVEFYVGNVEYDYEIDKTTGNIISFDKDIEGWAPGGTGTGTGTTGSITQEEAKTIALQHAGLTAAQVTFYRVQEDWDDGRSVYEVEFYVGNVEYDYEIDKSTGNIISFDKDIEGWAPGGTGTGTGTTGSITQEEAKNIALQHAGLTASQVTFYRVREDWDDGRSVYEVEFYCGNAEYDYEIDKATGKILSFDKDIEGWVPGGTGSPVTLEQARALVLARVPGLTAQSVRIHEDWDDGRKVYEGEAWYNGVEYEFEIDASTGTFLDWSQEGR